MSTQPLSSGAAAESPFSKMWIQLSPALFVLLWSTGFIGAKYGLPYAEPFTLLAIRMGATVLFLAVIALWLKSHSPSLSQTFHASVTGLLVHGCYLGGVFYAIYGGMPAGLTSLIVGLQPLVTALAAIAFLGERIFMRQWLGLLLGLVGVMLVLFEKMGMGSQINAFPAWTLLGACIALVGISIGTVYQKRYCQGIELVPGTIIQFCASGTLFTLGAFIFESREVVWNVQFSLALGWLVLGLSVGAILLLMQLISRGAASRVASLFYLVPPVTALEAYILFDERLGLVAMAGGLMAVVGVALVVIKSTKK